MFKQWNFLNSGKPKCDNYCISIWLSFIFNVNALWCIVSLQKDSLVESIHNLDNIIGF